jgi:tetratricopeptide (TPR) repeat protein
MLRKRSYFFAARAIVLLLVLLWLIPIPAAQADIAPPPPPESGSILPGQATQVRMVSEIVLVDIAPAGKGAPRAAVTASFSMRNLGEQPEQMEVRFPLNLLYPSYQSDLEECPYPEGGFPEISDFSARVDGQTVKVTTLTERLGNPDWGQVVKDVACWATFPVTFPPGEEVLIEAAYTATGYFGWDVDSLVEFPYVLVSGRDWAGTIGSAEITIRAPYELNNLNLPEVSPDDAQVSGREVRWRFTDLEPEWNVSATILHPQLWERINKEKATVASSPSDGEAWGRLGKAYKEANATRRGYRWDEGGPELYRLSREAYEKCLALLPKDADWHFGYAELLWTNAEYQSFGDNRQRRDDLVLAVDHLRQALAISPRHARALEMLDWIAHWWLWEEEAAPPVDLSGSKPDFLILTTTPTARLESTEIPTQTPLPSATLPASATPPEPPAATDAPAAETSTPAPIAAVTEALAAGTPAAGEPGQPETEPAPPQGGGARGLCGSAALPLAAVIGAGAWRRRKR